MLIARGADPQITTIKGPAQTAFQQGGARMPAIRTRLRADAAPARPGIGPLLAAAGVGYGEGFAGNAHRFAATGMMAAVKFLDRRSGRRRERARTKTATPPCTTPRLAATTR